MFECEIRRPGVTGLLRAAVLSITLWHIAFCLHPASTAYGAVVHVDLTPLEPAMQEKVRAALVKLKELPVEIASVETLLAVEPRAVETIGTNAWYSSNDPIKQQALSWTQALQPIEVLVASLEKGSNTAVYWALRQIV